MFKLKTRKVQRKVRVPGRVPSRRRGKALYFLDNLGMGRNHRRAQISNTTIIAVILLFCRMRTWFPWTLIHKATLNCEYEVHYFPLNCLLLLFALTSIPTYVYRVLLEGSKRSIDEKGDFATSWNAAGIGLKCALALPLCGCANTPTTGGPWCPSTEMKICFTARAR